MIRFIWRNWWRHKERFILLLVGALIISSGLSYLVGLSETSQGTIVDNLQKRWKASYDIVVRPPDTRSVTEEEGLLEPNYLSGLSGGISMEQFQEIKKIRDVEVAAPVAMIGYAALGVNFKDIEIKDIGIYRLKNTIISNNGVRDEVSGGTTYLELGKWSIPQEYLQSNDGVKKYLQDYGIGSIAERNSIPYLSLNNNQFSLLVGIDPIEEAKLVGLDQAVLPLGNGRYFSNTDKSYLYNTGNTEIPNIPVLMSKDPFVNEKYTYQVEHLNLPFDLENAYKTMETVKQNGGKAYLDQVEAVDDGLTYPFDSKLAHQILLQNLTGVNPETGERIDGTEKRAEINSSNSGISIRPSPLTYEKTVSPYPERWTYAYQMKQAKADNLFPYLSSYRFREPEQFLENKILNYNWIGFYDPQKLNISKDPLNELPMETYRPATAQLVLDGEGNPTNPPVTLKPTSNPFGFLTSPPIMLTTLEAAELIIGDKPIAAIRVNVKGVDLLNEQSQEKLEKVAAEIERRTGLLTDITLGSSPQPTIVYVPENKAIPALGWLEQPWVKIGASISIFRETKLGFSGVIASVLLVAAVYVFATNLVSLLARKKEFAVLLAVGWRPSQLSKMILLEGMIIGAIVALISLTMEGFALLQNERTISPLRFLLTGLIGFSIYILGAIWPGMLARKISPYETMRTGENAKTVRSFIRIRGLLLMSLRNVLGKLSRNLLSIFSIAVPTTLLMLFQFITFQLQGILYTTWLGQYISVEIGPAHYIAIMIALLVSVLTTAEIIWQNVAERKPEIALLKSMGWRNGPVRFLVLMEGFLSGLLAGTVGIGLGLVLIWGMYQKFPEENLLLVLSTGTIPLIVGILGAVLPSEIAVRTLPTQGMRGQYTTKKRIGKGLRLAFSTLIIIASIGSIATIIAIIPNQTAPTSSYNAMVQETENIQTEISSPTFEEEGKEIGNLSGFKPNSVSNGSNATYDISIQLNESGEFAVESMIYVTNTSKDNWNQLVFYFIPNVFTKENLPERIDEPVKVNIETIKINEAAANYDLQSDTLTLSLAKALQPNETVRINVNYRFTLPVASENDSLGFEKVDGNYYLGQWYPMLAPYRNGWNKANYVSIGKTYDSEPSDFTITYQIPQGYTFVSSGDLDGEENLNGQIEVKNIKEVYVAILKDMVWITEKVNGVEVRVYGHKEKQDQINLALETAKKVLTYYEQKIGVYPSKQLDIILDEIGNRVFPGVSLQFHMDDADFVKQKAIQQIVYQGFYNDLKVDPYDDGWIYDGFSELIASLYFFDYEKKSENDSFANAYFFRDIPLQSGIQKVSNLPLSEYQEGSDSIAFLAAQPALKLWELFDAFETREEKIEQVLRFIKVFRDTYTNKHVDTEEFVRFAKAYFNLKDDSYFEDWLEVRGE